MCKLIKTKSIKYNNIILLELDKDFSIQYHYFNFTTKQEFQAFSMRGKTFEQ